MSHMDNLSAMIFFPSIRDVSMPRASRAAAGGFCYHVLNRGNARAEVFHKDGDCDAFVQTIAEASLRIPLRVLAYLSDGQSLPPGALTCQ